jgi:response regulator NasT
MNSALIVSTSEKDTILLTALLSYADISQIKCVNSCESASKIISKQDFDLVIIDSPLPDESGEKFSRHIACKTTSQVIFLVKSETFESVSAACEENGVLAISKPLDKMVFGSILSLVKVVQNRVKRVQDENTQLKQKIEDIRIIDRAKCLLISYMKMSEQESHRYIEKQAMDMRSSRRIVAEGILKKYENF